MKSKLFTYKIIIPVCIILAALTAFSFMANSAIVAPRIEQMEYMKEYSPKLSDDGQFLIEFASDENGKKYGIIALFNGGYYYLKNAYVPSTYKDINITVIEEDAFSNFETLEKVVIPQSIKKIEKNAFKSCANLKEIYIPSGVENISKSAFDQIKFTMYVEKGSYAEKFAIENKINYKNYTPETASQNKTDYSKTAEDLGYKVFRYNVLYYDDEPFCAITSYDFMAENTKLNIPSHINKIRVTTLAEHSIYNNFVKEVILPETVTAVGDLAFSECSSLNKVYFTKNVSYIGKSIFENSPNAVICAPKNSYAEKYAKENNLKFEEIKK